MGNQKYMLVKHVPETNSAYLGREGGGGACVTRTNTAVVIGIWNKAGQMSNGQLQNAGDCNDLTEKMGEYLRSQGYWLNNLCSKLLQLNNNIYCLIIFPSIMSISLKYR